MTGSKEGWPPVNKLPVPGPGLYIFYPSLEPITSVYMSDPPIKG